MTDAELTFGALDFLDEAQFYAVADGFTTGAPEPLVTALPRLLLDGEILTHERDSNRDLTFRVEVVGDDVLALNEAEALLVREVKRPRNELRWKPPGMNTPVTVFETFAGSVTQVFDDLEEMRNRRVYTVTIPALPHARSEALRTAALVTPPASVTTLDAADSLTNWDQVSSGWGPISLDTSVKYQGAASIKSTGSYNIFGLHSGGGDALGFKRTASWAAPAGTHLVAVLRGNYPFSSNPSLTYTCTGAPAVQTSVVSAMTLADGWVQYTWALNNDAPITVTSFSIQAQPGTPREIGTYTITSWIDNVQHYALGEPVDKSGQRILDTGGSLRTPGTLRLSNDTTALGSVLAYTCADEGDGYRPDVARWYTLGGTRTSSVTSVSGYKHTTGAQFEVPNSSLKPGPYAVLVSGLTTTDTVTVQAQTVIGGALVGDQVTVSGTAGVSTISALGVIHLPADATPSTSAAKTRLTVNLGGPTGTTLDEVWLFRLDGQLTWLADLTAKRIWIESPTSALPYGAVWIGDQADQSDARHPGSALKMLGRHIFEAPVASVYVAATGAALSMDLLHYRRWHSNAAD